MLPGEVIPSAASSDAKVFSPTDSSPWAGGSPPASNTWRIRRLWYSVSSVQPALFHGIVIAKASDPCTVIKKASDPYSMIGLGSRCQKRCRDEQASFCPRREALDVS